MMKNAWVSVFALLAAASLASAEEKSAPPVDTRAVEQGTVDAAKDRKAQTAAEKAKPTEPAKAEPKAETGAKPAEDPAFDKGMKDFADDLQKKMTALGEEMARDIKAQLTPQMMKNINDAMGQIKSEAEKAAQKQKTEGAPPAAAAKPEAQTRGDAAKPEVSKPELSKPEAPAEATPPKP